MTPAARARRQAERWLEREGRHYRRGCAEVYTDDLAALLLAVERRTRRECARAAFKLGPRRAADAILAPTARRKGK